MKKIILSGATLAGIAALGCAQTYSSFHNVGTIYGVSVTQSGKKLTAKIQTGAYFVVSNVKYTITNGWGLFVLDGNGVLGSSFSGGTQNTNWGYNHKDASGKGIAGWQDTNKKGTILTPGGSSLSFTYSTADFSKVTGYGFHFTLPKAVSASGWGSENEDSSTYYVTGQMQSVPEPTGFIAVAVGLIGLVRRRKVSA